MRDRKDQHERVVGFVQAGISTAPFTDTTATSPAVAAAAQAIDTASLLQHIKDLAADSMEGRAPGTPGEEKAVAYLTQQFKALGLQPGNPDGTYIQNVDLIGYTAHPTASFTAKRKTISLRYPDDYIANSRHNRDRTPRRQLGRRLRRLRRGRPGVRLGRLQGRRRAGQDDPHARQRSRRCRVPKDPTRSTRRCSRARR